MGRFAVLSSLACALIACGQSSSSTPASKPDAAPVEPFGPAPFGDAIVGLAHPSHIVSDGHDLYITSGGGSGEPSSVYRVPLDGGAPTPFASASGAWGIAVDDEYVYWVDEISTDAGDYTGAGVIRRAPKDGGAPATIAQSPGPVEIAVDPTAVYWTIQTPHESAILSTALDGDASTTTLASIADGGIAEGIALDPTHVYWSQLNPDPLRLVSSFGFSNHLVRVSKLGGAPDVVANQGLVPFAPTSDDGGVYFSELDVDASLDPYSHGLMRRFDTASGTTTLIGASTAPAKAFSDGRYVYWTDREYGVFAAPVDGGATVHVASITPNAYPLGLVAVDGVIYWAEFGAHTVRSLRGPAAK